MKKTYMQPAVELTLVQVESQLLAAVSEPKDKANWGDGGNYKNEGNEDDEDIDDDFGDIDAQSKRFFLWDD